MEKVCRRSGKLLKGGEPDVNIVSRMILNDWQRGKIPFFTPPPGHDSTPFSQMKWRENELTQKHLDEEAAKEEEELKKVGRILKDDQLPPQPQIKQNLRGINLTVEYDLEDTQMLQDESIDDPEMLFNAELNDEDSSEENLTDEEREDDTTTAAVQSQRNEQGSEQTEDRQLPNKANLIDEEREDNTTAVVAVENERNGQGSEQTEDTQLPNKENLIDEERDDKTKVAAVENEQDGEQTKDIQLPNEESSDDDEAREIVGEELLSSESDLEEVDTPAGGTFTVRKLRRKRKLRPDEAPQEIMKCKERRKLERQLKRKKVGSNFYEVANVKNRNRERKIDVRYSKYNKKKK